METEEKVQVEEVPEERHAEKRSAAIEVHWENAITWGALGIFALLGGLFFRRYGEFIQGWADFRSFSWPLLVAAPLLIGYGVYRAYRTRGVGRFPLQCPYCGHENVLTEEPADDFVCDECTRRVPVLDGKVLEVTGVRCGFCGALNYLSDKTEVLICEECDREIPLLNPETGEMRHAPKGFARVDDDSLYELVLTDAGRDREAMITSLQHMLALNRNQVKKLLDELPAVLLTGINRRKAEMLRAQIEASEGAADLRALE